MLPTLPRRQLPERDVDGSSREGIIVHLRRGIHWNPLAAAALGLYFGVAGNYSGNCEVMNVFHLRHVR